MSPQAVDIQLADISVDASIGLTDIQLQSQPSISIGSERPLTLGLTLDSVCLAISEQPIQVGVEFAGPPGPAGPQAESATEVFIDGDPGILEFTPVAGEPGLLDMSVTPA